jgi:hypothetical protein
MKAVGLIGSWKQCSVCLFANGKLLERNLTSSVTLHADLGTSYVHEVIHQKCNKHHSRLVTHENPLLKTLLLREENRRLKRNWPIDLI